MKKNIHIHVHDAATTRRVKDSLESSISALSDEELKRRLPEAIRKANPRDGSYDSVFGKRALIAFRSEMKKRGLTRDCSSPQFVGEDKARDASGSDDLTALKKKLEQAEQYAKYHKNASEREQWKKQASKLKEQIAAAQRKNSNDAAGENHDPENGKFSSGGAKGGRSAGETDTLVAHYRKDGGKQLKQFEQLYQKQVATATKKGDKNAAAAAQKNLSDTQALLKKVMTKDAKWTQPEIQLIIARANRKGGGPSATPENIGALQDSYIKKLMSDTSTLNATGVSVARGILAKL